MLSWATRPSRCGPGSRGEPHRGGPGARSGGPVGRGVGAAAPGELVAIRDIAPALAFLVPGVGAQGGEVAPVLASGPATAPPAGACHGGGLLVNVSRAIARAAVGEPPPGASA